MMGSSKGEEDGKDKAQRQHREVAKGKEWSTGKELLNLIGLCNQDLYLHIFLSIPQ